MATSGPPAYAWDWFARQRLLWREVRRRLVTASDAAAVRYHAVSAKPDVVALLRTDYPRDPLVRNVVDRVVADLAFLGRTDRPYAALGLTSAPRGLRWWWTTLTGEEAAPSPSAVQPAPAPAQLSLQQILEGYGDPEP